jgi:hypothetical protein
VLTIRCFSQPGRCHRANPEYRARPAWQVARAILASRDSTSPAE